MFHRGVRPIALLLAAVTFAPASWGCKSRTDTPAVAPDATTTAQPTAPAEPPAPAAVAVATVDGTVVLTRDELDAQVRDVVERYERLPNRKTNERWRNQRKRRIVQKAVQDHLVNRNLTEATRAVTDADVEAVLKEELGNVFDDQKLFERYLQTQKKSRQQFYDEKRAELALDRFLAARGELEPSEDEIREYYDRNAERWREGDRVRASVITVRKRTTDGDQAGAKALERARELRKRVTTGKEDFAEVARKESDSADRIKGGDQGWIVKGRRAQLKEDGIEDVLFKVPVGSVTEPLETQLGYQIYRVVDRKPAGLRGLDEVREIIHEPLRRRKRDRLRLELVKELSATAKIEYLEDNWGLEPETNAPGMAAPQAGGSGDGAQ